MLLAGLIHSFLRRIILEPFCTFLYSLVSYIQPTVWWWVLYIIECDVIVIVSLRLGIVRLCPTSILGAAVWGRRRNIQVVELNEMGSVLLSAPSFYLSIKIAHSGDTKKLRCTAGGARQYRDSFPRGIGD